MNLRRYLELNLSIKECRVLKGIAIVMICMHNFCHCLPYATLENEYNFNLQRSLLWLDNFCDGGPTLILNIFSFWGHYGVPVFLFLSGYGLVKKYESVDSKTVSVFSFMKGHYIKLWRLLFLAVIMHAVVYQGYSNIWLPFLFTFTTNLIPNSDVIYGPWWFFSLIVQCYFLYATCFYNKNKYIPIVTLLVSIFLLIGIIAMNAPWQLLYYIRFNVFGWAAPFALGVLLARNSLNIPIWLPFLSMSALFLCEFNRYTWTLGSIFICFGLIPFIKFFNVERLKVLEYVGMLSPMLFVIHPLSRRVTFYLLGHSEETIGIYISILFYIVLTFISAYIYKKILSHVK